MTIELCRAPEDAVLTCLRDLEVLDEPLEARIGIAPDVALLVQDGTVIEQHTAVRAAFVVARMTSGRVAEPASSICVSGSAPSWLRQPATSPLASAQAGDVGSARVRTGRCGPTVQLDASVRR
ncbi:hypothetical protein NKH18_38535 [Streptomyces sp. M10(2022)]